MPEAVSLASVFVTSSSCSAVAECCCAMLLWHPVVECYRGIILLWNATWLAPVVESTTGVILPWHAVLECYCGMLLWHAFEAGTVACCCGMLLRLSPRLTRAYLL